MLDRDVDSTCPRTPGPYVAQGPLPTVPRSPQGCVRIMFSIGWEKDVCGVKESEEWLWALPGRLAAEGRGGAWVGLSREAASRNGARASGRGVIGQEDARGRGQVLRLKGGRWKVGPRNSDRDWDWDWDKGQGQG